MTESPAGYSPQQDPKLLKESHGDQKLMQHSLLVSLPHKDWQPIPIIPRLSIYLKSSTPKSRGVNKSLALNHHLRVKLV